MGDFSITDAMQDDQSLQQIEGIVTLMRMATARLFNDDPDNIPMNQGYSITAAALYAGTTAGHMIALGVMDEKDKHRVGKVLLSNFRSGIEVGKNEARKAMLEQTAPKGSA